MDKTVAKMNIEHFRKKLAQEDDPAQRQCLRNLLEEEERKLAAILSHEQEKQSCKVCRN